MYCPNCGKKNDLDALFCENCGARLILPTSSSAAPRSAASSATTRATSENEASRADTHSAANVDDHTTRAAQSDSSARVENTVDDTDDTVAPTTRSAQHAQQSPRPPHRGLPALLLALIVIVLVGGGYYWFSHNSANTDSNTTATSSSSTATNSSSSSAASTQSSSSSTTKTAAKWSTAKMSELSSFMSTWQDTMNQSYAGTYDGQSVSVDGLDLPTDIRDNNYQNKITVNGNAVKLTWTTKANMDANYQVVAAAAYQHGTQVIIYLYVFHDGSPDVLVSQDTNTTYNFTSSANTDLQNGFAKIANAD